MDDREAPEVLGSNLVSACKKGNENDARALLLEGAPPNFEDPTSKWTPLIWAACNGHLSCVNVLLDFHASDMYIDADAPMHKGRVGRPNTAPAMMQGSAHARIVLESSERNSPLHWAAFKGHLRIVWRLINAGLNIHDVDACGNSALHLAVAGGWIPVVTCLLSNGAGLAAKNYYGNTPLELTTQCEVRAALTQLMGQKTYELGMGSWSPGSDPWPCMRQTTIVMRGARILCSGPWCRSESTHGHGMFWSVTSAVKPTFRTPSGETLRGKRLRWDSNEARPEMVCRVCLNHTHQAEVDLQTAISDKSLAPLLSAISVAAEAEADVGMLHGESIV